VLDTGQSTSVLVPDQVSSQSHLQSSTTRRVVVVVPK
jgi:hypothetical protein